MSGIVIRCPNCGTTQGALGECEACHEATTRWFCPNHEPGLWLDAPICPTCGARPGVSGTRPQRRPSSGRATPPRVPSPSRSRTPPGVELPPPEEREEPGTEPWRGPVYSPRDPREAESPFVGAPGAWRLDPSVVLPAAARVVSVFGCLRRLVVLAFVLFLLAVVAFYFLFGVGGVFHSAVPDESAPHYADSRITSN